MKICPKCRESYQDDSLNFCLNDGTALEVSGGDPRTAAFAMGAARPTGSAHRPEHSAAVMSAPSDQPKKGGSKSVLAWVAGIFAAVLLVCGGTIGGFLVLVSKSTPGTTKTVSGPTPESKRTADKTANSPDDRGGYSVTMDKYNRIKIGTSRDEVESILGGKGTEISSSEGGGMRFSVNKWEGEKFTSIILSFKNDKVMSKNQVGLR